MKKIKLFIMMILLITGGTAISRAQQVNRGNMPMRGYFQQTVLPFVKQQQAQLEQALTATERVQLEKIRAEAKTFRRQGAQMRKAMNGHFNQQAWDSRKAQWDAIVAKVRKLLQAHPQAAEAYRVAIRNEMAKWKSHMPAMQKGNRMGQAKGMKGNNRKPFMQRLADPAFGLLMDTEAMGKMMAHAAKKWQGKPAGQRIQPHRAFMLAMQNPEVKAKITEYRTKHILPVIRTQREAFDRVLSKKEKKVLAEARADMNVQRKKMLEMRKSGMRPNDSIRLVLQQQMDKDRMAVRKIMLDHYSTLQKSLAPIKEKMPQWRADIRKIVVQYTVEQQMKQFGRHQGTFNRFPKEKQEMMFLLMDPHHPEGFMPFFGHGNQ